jgi:hypothetical protein
MRNLVRMFQCKTLLRCVRRFLRGCAQCAFIQNALLNFVPCPSTPTVQDDQTRAASEFTGLVCRLNFIGDNGRLRALIAPHRGDKRYVRRKAGKFTSEQVSAGRSLTADRRSKAKRIVKRARAIAVTGVDPVEKRRVEHCCATPRTSLPRERRCWPEEKGRKEGQDQARPQARPVFGNDRRGA